MEDAVYALVATVYRLPHPSLMHIPRLLTNAAFRRRAVGLLDNSTPDDIPALEFWSDYETLPKAASESSLGRSLCASADCTGRQRSDPSSVP
jgi:hypothetical protein